MYSVYFTKSFTKGGVLILMPGHELTRLHSNVVVLNGEILSYLEEPMILKMKGAKMDTNLVMISPFPHNWWSRTEHHNIITFIVATL